MLACKVGCRHRDKVWAYREERQRQEQLAEETSNGYDTELKEYLSENRLITFKEWLIHTKET